MDHHKIKENVEAISLPDAARSRIRANLVNGSHNPRKAFSRKPLVIAAALVLCLALPIGTAAAGRRGQFRDVYNWQHAVVGTAYDNATEEIAVTAQSDGNTLLVKATLLVPEQAPYPYISMLSIDSYRIVDANGKPLYKVHNEAKIEAAECQGNSFVIPISLTAPLPSGSALVIETFVATAEFEQPLPISGNWNIPIRTIQ